MGAIWLLFILVPVKLIAYAVWCFYVLTEGAESKPPRLGARVFAWTLARLALGAITGYVIWGLLALLPQENLYRGFLPQLGGSWIMTYVTIFLTVRWLEWSAFQTVLCHGPWKPKAVLLGASGTAFKFRAIGLAFSIAADLFMLHLMSTVSFC